MIVSFPPTNGGGHVRSQVVVRPSAVIERLPLHVQARIACIDAIAANSRSMMATADSIMREGVTTSTSRT